MTLGLALFIHGIAVLVAVLYLRLRVERALSMLGLTLLILSLIHGIPVWIYLLVTGPDTVIFEAALEKVDRVAIMAQLPLALALMFTSLLLGAEAARLLFGGLPRRPAGLSSRRLQVVRWRNHIRLDVPAKIFLWFVALAMLSVSIIENQIGKTWSYFASGESEFGKILLRVEEGGTPFYLYNVLLSAVAPFLVMITICAARNERNNAPSWLLAIALSVAVVMGKFGTLSKAPPVLFLLQLLLLYILLRRKRLNVWTVFQMLVASILLFGAIVSATVPDLDVQAIASFLYYRTFDITNEVLLEYFAAIPHSIEHGYGAGIFSFLRGDTKGEYIPMMSAVAELTRGNLISTSNPLFIGDAWAEFGWFGIFSFSGLAGFILYSYDRYAFRNGNTDEAACLVAAGTYGIVTLVATALNTALVTGGLLIMPLVAHFLISSPLPAPRTVYRPAPLAHP